MWCSDESLASKLGLNLSTVTDANVKVCEFITPNKQWDSFELNQLLPTELVQLIQGILIPYIEVLNSFY